MCTCVLIRRSFWEINSQNFNKEWPTSRAVIWKNPADRWFSSLNFEKIAQIIGNSNPERSSKIKNLSLHLRTASEVLQSISYLIFFNVELFVGTEPPLCSCNTSTDRTTLIIPSYSQLFLSYSHTSVASKPQSEILSGYQQKRSTIWILNGASNVCTTICEFPSINSFLVEEVFRVFKRQVHRCVEDKASRDLGPQSTATRKGLKVRNSYLRSNEILKVSSTDFWSYSQKSSRWRLWSACAPNIRWRNCLKGSEKNFSKRTWRWRKVFHSLKVRKICDDTRNPLPRYTIRYVKESNWYISIILLPTGPAHQATVHFPKTIWIHCLDSLNTINS